LQGTLLPYITDYPLHWPNSLRADMAPLDQLAPGTAALLLFHREAVLCRSSPLVTKALEGKHSHHLLPTPVEIADVHAHVHQGNAGGSDLQLAVCRGTHMIQDSLTTELPVVFLGTDDDGIQWFAAEATNRGAAASCYLMGHQPTANTQDHTGPTASDSATPVATEDTPTHPPQWLQVQRSGTALSRSESALSATGAYLLSWHRQRWYTHGKEEVLTTVRWVLLARDAMSVSTPWYPQFAFMTSYLGMHHLKHAPVAPSDHMRHTCW
jgi:hypothetical protein